MSIASFLQALGGEIEDSEEGLYIIAATIRIGLIRRHTRDFPSVLTITTFSKSWVR